MATVSEAEIPDFVSILTDWVVPYRERAGHVVPAAARVLLYVE